MEGGPSPRFHGRLFVVAVGVFALLSLIVIRFYHIQIIQGAKWKKQALLQHQLVIREPSKRGVFFASSYVYPTHLQSPTALVVDVPSFHLYLDPLSIPEERREELGAHLIDYLNLNPDEGRVLARQFTKNSRSRRLAMWLGQDVYENLSSWWKRYAKKHKIARNGLYFIQDYRRSYPYGKLLGQVLHTVREKREKDTNNWIPTGGLELSCDEYLRGKEGKRILLRSPKQALEIGKEITPAEDGADVYLTVNQYLQAIAEEELAKGVKKVKAKGGIAVMVEPKSGKILALAQYPFFNPNYYRSYYNDSTLTEHTQIKAISYSFEPGSIFKPITAALALLANQELERRGEEPLFDPEGKMSTLPRLFPGRYTPIRDVRTHQFLNLYGAMQKSSNVYVATLSERIIKRMGGSWYRQQLSEVFGFGKKTQVELPYENPGVLPTPGKMHSNGTLEWSASTPYSLAMGHNILVNSLQMVRAFSLFANGGYPVDLSLIEKISKTNRQSGEIEELPFKKNYPIKEHKRVLPKSVVDEVVKSMRYVTKPGGGAPLGDVHGYTEAGKTGTSEKIVGGSYSKKQHFSTFIGFTPVHEPRFVLLVCVDEPAYGYLPGYGHMHYGGKSAAPIFQAIAQRSLSYLGVEPDDPYGYPVGDPRRDVNKSDWSHEVQLLQEQYKKWNAPLKKRASKKRFLKKGTENAPKGL